MSALAHRLRRWMGFADMSYGRFASLLLLCAVALSTVIWMEFAAAITSNPTPSISVSFDAFWTAARGRPFEEQEVLWERLIEQPRQDIYTSVVWETKDYPQWKQNKELLLRQRFNDYPRVADQISPAARTLEAQFPIQSTRFRELFPDAPAHPGVQLVLAPNFDAKSGVLGNGSPVLIFAVDSLVIEHADMSVLFPHELFHLYHANHAGIQNDGVMPGANLTLPLFAEGLATYVSSVLSPNHSDGQLLLQSSLGAIPIARLKEVAARFLSDADKNAIDPLHPQAFARWFMGSKEDYQPDLPNRAGYWLGLHVIRQMRHKHSLRAMASWPPSKAQTQTRVALLEMARGTGRTSGPQ